MEARVFVLFVAACSPAQTQTVEISPAQTAVTPAPTASATATPTPTASAPSRPACPSSYTATPRPTCANGDNPGQCTYPEGSCFCGHPPYCGGAAPRPMPPVWICEAPRTPCPRAGTPCQGNAQCHDGACSWQGVVRCEHGVWTSVMVPPPP